MSALRFPKNPADTDPYALYLTDTVSDLFTQTNKYLDRPAALFKESQDLYNRYEMALANAEGVHGLRYDADRVQSSHRPHDDVLADLADMSDKYRSAYDAYQTAYEEVNTSLLMSGLNRAQYLCIWYRHLSDRIYSYDEISKMISKKYSMDAFRIYKKAFAVFSRYLESHGIISAPEYVPPAQELRDLDADGVIIHDFSVFADTNDEEGEEGGGEND